MGYKKLLCPFVRAGGESKWLPVPFTSSDAQQRDPEQKTHPAHYFLEHPGDVSSQPVILCLERTQQLPTATQKSKGPTILMPEY